MALTFHKVNTLPGSLQPDSLYFVANDGYTETYLTSSTGAAKSVGNSAMIKAIADKAISDALAAASANPVEIVANIAARNELTASATTNKLILVTDATGDTTVTAGAALYVFNKVGNVTTKIAEYESIDVVLTWASIQGRPNADPTLIDDAVSKRHSHANSSVLNKLGDTDGALTYSGSKVSAVWATTNW